MKRLLLVANQSWNFWNFRRELIQHLLAKSYEVHLLSPVDSTTEKLKKMGARHVEWPLDARGKSVGRELRSIWFLYKTIRRLRPKAVCTFTIKPNLYGGLVSGFCKVPMLMNVTGLGEVFLRRDPLAYFVRRLYSYALKKAHVVFFQNSEDEKVIRGFIPNFYSRRVPGSGVNLDHFVSAPKSVDLKMSFGMVARLLPEKGVAEYVAAAQTVRKKFPHSHFVLVGDFVTPASRAQLWPLVESAVRAGDISYSPHVEDVRPVFEQLGTVVLPTYYNEGVPRTLLEAAAMSRLLITTDRPGCRDVVNDGETGFLCQPRSVNSLVSVIEKVLQTEDAKWNKMTTQAHELVRDNFNVNHVIKAYDDELDKIEGPYA